MMLSSVLSEQDQARLQKVANRLFAANFLTKEKERDDYVFIRRHKQAFEETFRFLGWEFVLDERHDCVFVRQPDGGLKRTLDKEESIWLLVLRLLYQEKRQSLSLSEFPMVTLHEIRSKYSTFRLPWVNKTKLDKLVRLCEGYQLVDALDSEIRADDCRFRLFHTWQYVIDTDELQGLRDRIDRYEAGQEGGLTDEMDEEAAND